MQGTCVKCTPGFICNRIDASSEKSCLARFINDEEKRPNCKMKKLVFNNIPHLCLFALTDINRGDELRYNYGEDEYPWRKTLVSVLNTFDHCKSLPNLIV